MNRALESDPDSNESEIEIIVLSAGPWADPFRSYASIICATWSGEEYSWRSSAGNGRKESGVFQSADTAAVPGGGVRRTNTYRVYVNGFDGIPELRLVTVIWTGCPLGHIHFRYLPPLSLIKLSLLTLILGAG